MCVNLQTSIIAFIVGIICGLILATENNEKRALGVFIMFYSFVQLCEAYIYYFGNDENGYFHRFTTCVLESMDVSYGGEQFSSFRDGSPTEINMSLTFRELEILTKNMISEGY